MCLIWPAGFPPHFLHPESFREITLPLPCVILSLPCSLEPKQTDSVFLGSPGGRCVTQLGQSDISPAVGLQSRVTCEDSAGTCRWQKGRPLCCRTLAELLLLYLSGSPAPECWLGLSPVPRLFSAGLCHPSHRGNVLAANSTFQCSPWALSDPVTGLGQSALSGAVLRGL